MLDYQYGYLTRDMINEIEVRVEYSDRHLIDEIKKYNSTVPECKRLKMLVEFGKNMYLIMQVAIVALIMIKNYLDMSINNGEGRTHIYIVALIYIVGMYVLIVVKENFNGVLHGIFAGVLLFIAWNCIFMIPINIIACKIYNDNHLRVIGLFGYPNFHEVKIVFLDKETIELMDIHTNGFGSW